MKTLILVVIVVLAGIGLFVWQRGGLSTELTVSTSMSPNPLATASVSASPTGSSNPSVSPTPQQYLITYTDAGYSPSNITVPLGATITWKNQSTRGMWTAADPHPIHNSYPEGGGCINSDFDACKQIQPGQTYSFTFKQKGTWGYHNHARSSDRGTITVQ